MGSEYCVVFNPLKAGFNPICHLLALLGGATIVVRNSITFFSFKNHVVNEIMRKSIMELDRPQVPIWPMRIALWTPKAKNIFSEYLIFIAILLQQWLHERVSMLRYVYTAGLVSYN